MSTVVADKPTELDVEREQLLKSLADADVSAFDTANIAPVPQAEEPVQESVVSDDKPSEVEPEKPADEDSSGEDKPEKTEAEEKSSSKYSRAKKTQERANKTWREVNAEKAALKKEREQLAAEQKAFKEQQSESLAEIEQRSAQSRYSPDEYEAIAKEFEDEGDHSNAEAARKAAEQARKAVAEQDAKAQQAKFVSQWDTNWKAAAKEHKDLNDQNSELFKMVGQLLERKPVLTQYPEGITDAVEGATMYLQANRAESLEKQVSELQKKVAEYEEKTQLNGSQPGGNILEVESFDKLPVDKQRVELMKAMQQADDSGAAMFATN
tara:strand:+ start:171 stop:1142 length:972 start_codon:yes stop_codon:yes gene_type:complete